MEPTNLFELLERLRKQPTTSLDAALNLLHKLVGDSIKISYELLARGTKRGVGKYAYLAGGECDRIMLSTNRYKADFSKELHRECNGVVISYPEWKLLSLPPRMFNLNFNGNVVEKNLQHYKIYPVNDGTLVTLYHHNSAWRISSANGFDVGRYRWMGDMTYMEALEAVLAMYPGFSWEGLSTDCCYNIIFRHDNFHPLAGDGPKAWLVNITDTQTWTQQDANCGIPMQQPVGGFDETNMDALRAKCVGALASYLKTGKTPFYGWVLRSTTLTGRDSANSDIVMESDLLKEIRRLMYNLPKNKLHQPSSLDHTNRQKYMCLKAYLNFGYKYDFIKLFPRFKTDYQKYDEYFTALVDRVVHLLRNKGATLTNPTEEKKSMEAMANNLRLRVLKNGRINVMDSNIGCIVRDFIVDKEYLNMYFNVLCNERNDTMIQ